jgi:hypothetical protein
VLGCVCFKTDAHWLGNAYKIKPQRSEGLSFYNTMALNAIENCLVFTKKAASSVEWLHTEHAAQ